MCKHCGTPENPHGISRRHFLGMTAAAGAAVTAIGPTLFAATPQDSPPVGVESPRLRVVYLRPKGKYWLGWPGTAWDPEGFFKSSKAAIEGFAKDLKMTVEFDAEPLYTQEQVNALLAKLKDTKPQGVIVIPLHMDRWGQVDQLAKSGLPTIIFAGLGLCFTGHIGGISRLPGVYLASTADYDLGSIRFGMKLIRAHHDILRTKIAVLHGNETKEQALEPFGLRVKHLPRKLFPDVYKTIQETPEVRAMADEYAKNAKKCVEPTRADLINASRCYFATLKILKDAGCDGITMDCLGLVGSRELPTPPCLAWCKLLDEGKLGVCEADLNAVMSELLCLRLLDKPGFIQDPVPETVHNTFIGAHCVCGTKLNGFDKPAEPFILRSHSESNIGVSLQVLWKEGQEVTVMQMAGAGRMILGHGKVLRNLDTPPCGGCRTSVERALDAPADTRNVKGFHQLFIYGNHVRDFQAYGQMWGIATESI